MGRGRLIRRTLRRFGSHPRVAAVRDFLTPPNYVGTRWTAKRLANLYLSRWEQRRGRTVLRSLPVKLTVDATSACQLRCPACFTGAGEVGRQGGAMPLALYRRLLEDLGDTLAEVELCNWGEPLLGRNLFDMIAAAARRGISTTISTNFSLPFDAQRAERLVTSGLAVLGVSIDGATQAGYEQYRIGGRLDLVLRNCRLVADAKHRLGARLPRLIWSYHVFPHNEHEVGDAARLAAELGMEFTVLKGLVIGPDWTSTTQWPEMWSPKPPRRCQFLWGSAVVATDGGVSPCCGTFYAEDDIGMLSTDGEGASFRDIWNGPRYRAARKLFDARAGSAAEERMICFGCSVRKAWMSWSEHRARGGTSADFAPQLSANESHNYFWKRRPLVADSKRRR